MLIKKIQIKQFGINNLKMKKKLSVLGWIGSFLIAIALINWGTWFWFNFNIVEAITFGVRFLAGFVYTVVALLGLIALGELLFKIFK